MEILFEENGVTLTCEDEYLILMGPAQKWESTPIVIDNEILKDTPANRIDLLEQARRMADKYK